MAADGESKFGGKDYWADIALTFGMLALVGIFVELAKGRARKWGERIHGYRHDGSHVSEYPMNHPEHKPKKLKPAEEEEEEHSFARAK